MEEKYQSTEHSIDLGRLHDFIRQHGEAVDYRRGERLETEGEPARWLAFVERGQFKYVVRGISDGREHIAAAASCSSPTLTSVTCRCSVAAPASSTTCR